MAYSGKFTTYVGVVESAFRDSGLEFIDFEAATEWTAELIGLIGSPYILINKVTNGADGMPSALIVEEYKAKLPDDLEVIMGIRKVELDSNGEIASYSAMMESTDIFHHTKSNIRTAATSAFNPVVNIVEFEPQDENFIASTNQYEILNNGNVTGRPFQYKIDSGYIYTNFEDGYVEIAYKGFPIDNNGFPMIPDDEKFRQALKYHIIYKCDWRNWRINPSPQNKSIVNDSEARRDFYVGAARNKSHIPSLDKMEALKNMWLRSITNVNAHLDGFGTMNIQEQRFNNTSSRRKR